jgi:GNAT superfamily N-acetyltransferase
MLCEVKVGGSKPPESTHFFNLKKKNVCIKYNDKMLSITKFTPFEHTKKILSIGKRIFNTSDVSLLEKALQECSQEYSRIYIQDESILGFALVRKRNQHIEVYELAFLGVDPHHHGKGIGSKLLKAIEQLQPNGSTCWLLVNQDNNLAQNLYSKFGFHILCDCFDSFNVPCYVMIKTNTAIKQQQHSHIPLHYNTPSILIIP